MPCFSGLFTLVLMHGYLVHRGERKATFGTVSTYLMTHGGSLDSHYLFEGESTYVDS